MRPCRGSDAGWSATAQATVTGPSSGIGTEQPPIMGCMADRIITLTASLTPEEGGYVARCMELAVTTEGDTVEEALAMLREAVELYLEDEPVPDRLAHPVVTSFDVTVTAA